MRLSKRSGPIRVTRLTYSLEHFGQIGGCIQSFSADFSRVGQGAGQQQVLRATSQVFATVFAFCLKCVWMLLARKFHETKDLKISDEIYWLAGEHINQV